MPRCGSASPPPQPSPLAGALSSGSAFTAFADPGMPIPGSVSGLENAAATVAASACAPSAEQINALADVMLFFPNGGAVPGDKVAAAAFAHMRVPKTSEEPAPSSAERIERIDANGPNGPVNGPLVHSTALPTVPTVREAAKDGKEDGARAPDSSSISSVRVPFSFKKFEVSKF